MPKDSGNSSLSLKATELHRVALMIRIHFVLCGTCRDYGDSGIE